MRFVPHLRPDATTGTIARRARPASPPVLTAILVVLIVACSDGEPSPGDARADQIRDAVAGAGLPDDVADVLALAARADGTYRVTYELVDQTVTVAQRPPDRRVDTTSPDGTVDAVINVDGETHACTDPAGTEGWRCDALGEPTVPGVFDSTAVDALADSLVASAERYAFSVQERDVAGTPARCLVTRLRPEAVADPSLGSVGALCVADSGAILLVERPTGTLRASAYDTGVPDDAFRLPA